MVGENLDYSRILIMDGGKGLRGNFLLEPQRRGEFR